MSTSLLKARTKQDDLDQLDKALLDYIQSEFPLAQQPYAQLAERLDTEVDGILARISRLKSAGIIRQISAIFDTRSLGYSSSLVAAKLDPAHLDVGARVINEHPGVSHNYVRNHDYNLWFTIAVPPNSRIGLDKTVEILKADSGAQQMWLMPTLRLFKIGMKLDMKGEGDAKMEGEGPRYSEEDRATDHRLTDFEIAAIRELQEDIPVIAEPFAEMAARLGVTPAALFETAAQLKARGQMRRYAAVLHHRKAGFTANAMGVWIVPPEKIAETGAIMGRIQAISHCYQRPTYPDWPYSIFTMVHGRKAHECEEKLEFISQATGITEYRALFSYKEYKKTRVKYFTPEMEAWEEAHLDHPVLRSS